MKKFLSKNKVLIIVTSLILLIVLGFYSTVFGSSYENLDFKYGKVKAKCLNIRCGPGITYNKVGKLYKGEYINVFAKVGSWYIIQTNSDLIGAVSSEYIEAVYNEEEVLKRNTSTKKTENASENVSQNQQKEAKNVSEKENKQENKTVETSTDAKAEISNSSELTQEEKEFLELINSNRKNNGLEELKIDENVQNVARLKAKDLEENNYFSHKSETYGDIATMLKTFEVECSSSAENIAGNKTLAGAVEAWMNSDTHKVNILNKEFNYTGIAIVDSKTYGKIFVEVFVKK